jgi:heterotetrameric sarcosine oxidase delta subunit
VTHRPRTTPSQQELSAYVYFRRNVAGVQREWWNHLVGCELWFLADRDTRTNEVLHTELPQASAETPAAR